MSEAKILIVEDEGIAAMDIQQRLAALGYPLPDIAYSAEEGLGKVEKTRPDLVLMDIMMPGKMDGVAAAEQIRSRFDIPIIFLTAYSDENTLRRAKITAPYGYILKPFQERELHIAVDMALYRHKMERELRESEELFRLMVENIKDYAIFMLDPEGLVTTWNEGSERLKGYKSEEIIGQHFSLFYTADDAASGRPQRELETARASGRFEDEGWRMRKDGSSFWANVLITALIDNTGSLRGFSKVTRDSTERKKADEALRKAYDELEARVEERTRELKAAEISLREINETLEQRVAERTAELQAAITSLRDSRRATLNIMEDSLSARKLVEEANAGLRQEVTERKKAEADVLKLSEDMAAQNVELEAANKEMESFIYSISHDLRAPLRSISGFARIMVEDYAGALNEQGQDYLLRIRRGSEKMTALIDNLLYLSRISRQEMEKTEVNISKIATSILADLREANPGRNVSVRIEDGVTVSADRQLMEIILSNLLENAWKFTSKTDNARIEFGAVREEIGPMGLVFFVRDNGSGFDPEYSDRMFLPFHRLHSDDEFEGTGIGLTIVERLIHRHGGRVWAEGEKGKGATVYFTLR